MDIRKKILEIRTSRDKTAFVQHFAAHPNQIDELMKCVVDLEEYPYKEYASWILIHVSKSAKIDLNYLYKDFVDLLFKTKDQTVLRNILCILKQLKVTKYRETELIDLLLEFIKDASNKVALQIYSIHLLIHFVKRYPDLKQEVSEMIALHRKGKTVSYSIAERNFKTKTAKF